MRKRLLAAAAAMVLHTAWAATPSEQEVLAFEKQRCDAVMRRDLAALRAMMTDDLTYVHASGLKQTRQEYLDYVAAGKVTYTSYAIEQPSVHLADAAAVTHGIFKYENVGATPGSIFYTAFYVRENGAWKLSAWQATLKKPASP
jgi:hypothetical protein